MKQNNSKKRHIRNDIFLIVALLLAVAIGGIYLFVFRSQGDIVKVTVNGQTYGIYSLSEDIIEDIHTGEGDKQHNRLVIRGGKAFVESATCPDGICASHRPIFRDGESIVCLPHGVVITVTAAEKDDAPDIVT